MPNEFSPKPGRLAGAVGEAIQAAAGEDRLDTIPNSGIVTQLDLSEHDIINVKIVARNAANRQPADPLEELYHE